ncbi:hypothetical protein TNCV_5141 [Trichonephila clavipes]|nr:hypothetical protein TNCV_5141 [Trichonephila clavipes]
MNGCLENQILHVTKTRLTLPSVHTCKGRVVWNTPFLVQFQVQSLNVVPIAIRRSIHDSIAHNFAIFNPAFISAFESSLYLLDALKVRRKSGKKEAQSSKERVWIYILQKLPSEISDVLTNDFSDKGVPANYL